MGFRPRLAAPRGDAAPPDALSSSTSDWNDAAEATGRKGRRPKEPRQRRRSAWLRNPIPLLDRYLASEVLMVTAFCILGFAILIVGNNFYNTHDLIMKKEFDIPIPILGWLSVLDAPASMVLSLPIATTFGVMLAIGRMGRDSEIIAMRAGGASMGRILIPILMVGLLLSVLNYYAGERWVPQVSRYTGAIKRQYISKESEHTHREIFFRDPGLDQMVYTVDYNSKTKTLQQPFMIRVDDLKTPGDAQDDLLHFYYTSMTAQFEGDELVMAQLVPVKHHVCARNPALNGWELWYKEDLTEPEAKRFPFPQALQRVPDVTEKASALAGRDLVERIDNARAAGQNTVRDKTDLAVKKATPVACGVFAFVAFIFGVVNPRREKFTGVFYALVMIFWYYVINAVCKNLGYNGIIRPPELAAWLTNIVFFIMAGLLFLRMR